MAKKKPKKPKAKKPKGKLISVEPYAEQKCANAEQAEAALVYAVRSFNKYFKEGVIIARVEGDKYKVVTFGAGDPRDHFKPVMWHAIKAAYEAFREGPTDDQIFDG